LATRDFDEVFVGAVLVALLSLLVELGLGAFQRVVVPTGLRHRVVATAELDEAGVT
jgi:ABC-type proline/glycine betaine transport system permease subunit